MKRHPLGRPDLGEAVYTALQQQCDDCGRRLPIYQVPSRRVQQLGGELKVKRQDKRCTPDCCGPRPIIRAPRDTALVLPRRVYGIDITLLVGERHLVDGVALAQIARDLKRDHGIAVDQRHTCRIFRDYLTLTKLASGDDAALQQRLVAQGGIVLMCDGVQHDNRSPVLYLVWDALSGEPLFGERKQFRGEEDLLPLLERVRAMSVPVIGAVTDKEKALIGAVKHVFPDVPHQYCQTHFLRNCAKPLEDERKELGESVRRRADNVRKIIKSLHVGSTTDKKARTDDSPGPSELTEQELARQVGDLVRDNSRVSGKMPLDPPELERHKRLEQVRSLVDEAAKKKRASDRTHRMAPAGRTVQSAHANATRA